MKNNFKVRDVRSLAIHWNISEMVYFSPGSTHHFAGAVNNRLKFTVHINNMVSSEFPNRSFYPDMANVGLIKLGIITYIFIQDMN